MADRKAISKNRLNSGIVWPVLPSAIFKQTESPALFICEARLYHSSTGKVLASKSTSFVSFNAICQIFNSSNLNAITVGL